MAIHKEDAKEDVKDEYYYIKALILHKHYGINEISDVIVTGAAIVVSVGIFIAGTAIFAPLLSSLGKIQKGG